jgi:ribosomal protein S18 acetylase RimI-like enzyme
MNIELTEARAAAAAAERVLRSVPEWFGVESSTVHYIEQAAALPTWVASVDGASAGFVSIKRHFPEAADIYCMAVHRDFHGRGIGTALVRAVEAELARDGVEYLQVKTQGPSRPCEYYSRTLRFYLSVGFTPLEELHGLWGELPALILVKRLGAVMG